MEHLCEHALAESLIMAGRATKEHAKSEVAEGGRGVGIWGDPSSLSFPSPALSLLSFLSSFFSLSLCLFIG